MPIKAVTFQGAANFNSNLYALEMKTRFINQSAADGYFEGYGKELEASAVGNQITVGSGAFVVQGRVIEIDLHGAAVTVSIENGRYGYVCARIETYPASGTEHCSLVIKTGVSLSDISLTREDTYQSESEYENKVYELPLYSFYMNDNTVTDLTKIIQPIRDFQRMYEKEKTLENAYWFKHHLRLTFEGEAIGKITLYCDINSKSPTKIDEASDFCNLLKNVNRHSCTGIVLGKPNISVGIVTSVTYKSSTTFGIAYAGVTKEGVWLEINDIVGTDACTTVTDTVT